MKKQSRTVPRRRQSVSPTPRHLPLVDILIDTQAELQELVVALVHNSRSRSIIALHPEIRGPA